MPRNTLQADCFADQQQFDVILIGGNFAGLSAALQIACARRQVLIVDAGQPRNCFAAGSHGFLSQDGEKPRISAHAAMAMNLLAKRGAYFIQEKHLYIRLS